jgi:hypothetical protein
MVSGVVMVAPLRDYTYTTYMEIVCSRTNILLDWFYDSCGHMAPPSSAVKSPSEQCWGLLCQLGYGPVGKMVRHPGIRFDCLPATARVPCTAELKIWLLPTTIYCRVELWVNLLSSVPCGRELPVDDVEDSWTPTRFQIRAMFATSSMKGMIEIEAFRRMRECRLSTKYPTHVCKTTKAFNTIST